MRRWFLAWAAGDFNAWVEFIDEDVEWFPVQDHPQVTPVHGREAVLGLLADWLEPWEEYDVRLDHLVDAGENVLAFARHTGRMNSGAEVDIAMSTVAGLRDGRVVQARFFLDEADASKPLGCG